MRRHTALVLVSGIHRGVVPALRFATSLAPDNTTALYVELNPEDAAKVQAKWAQWGCGVPLIVLESPYRALVEPVLRYLDEVEQERSDDVVTVIIPEFVSSRWWEKIARSTCAAPPGS